MNTDTKKDVSYSMLVDRIFFLKRLQRKLYDENHDFDLIMQIEKLIEKHATSLDEFSGTDLGRKLLIVLATTNVSEWENIPRGDSCGFAAYFDGLWKQKEPKQVYLPDNVTF